MFKLRESINEAIAEGRLHSKSELARILWGGSSNRSAYMNYNNLASGKSKKIDIDAVPVICEKLGVSADYLFGLSDIPRPNEALDNLKESIKENLEAINIAIANA